MATACANIEISNFNHLFEYFNISQVLHIVWNKIIKKE